MPFTNENGRFQTDTRRGHAHGEGQPLGSVFPGPIGGDDYTLWLEHVVEYKGTPEEDGEWFWFVWYGPNGNCTTKTSAVFKAGDLAKTISLFIERDQA